MTALPVDLEFLKAQALAEEQATVAINAACIATLQNPARIVQLNVHATAVEVADGQFALLVAQPHGELVRIQLSPAAARDLARSLTTDDIPTEPDRSDSQ